MFLYSHVITPAHQCPLFLSLVTKAYNAPATETYPLGQVLQLVGQSLLLDDAALRYADLAQREVRTGLRHAELL